ncbi:hypothetical protein [Paenibacillus contaminans]|uniref:Cthe-2314-like HEPN domain-containing protein n=1 Tax=Paenibacillus contaminans TaxID=450362 RepID=A0A329LKI6_9BACL|nr:hypothetical protein [Paenibacillus contaminans]RAV08725.1 hypothetical protein DQG23_40640 [Paenibacillus contaminans]
MGESIEVCLGCGKKLNNVLQFEVFTFTPGQYVCSECTKKFKKQLTEIRNGALEIIIRNRSLNEKFDEFVESEEIFDHLDTHSFYLHGSHQAREYMFSLLEEVHRFAYHATFECHLFCDMFENADPMFFSDRYFLTNSVIKTIGAWEKLLRFHCLYFEVQLDRDPKNNSLSRLQKKMNKTEFKQTNLYSEYIRLKSNNSFGEIDKARKNNDHNVSYHLEGKNFLELSELAEMILENTSALYNGIDEALELLTKRTRLATRKFNNDFGLVNKIEENDKIFKKKALKIKSKFNLEDISQINQLSVDYISWASNRLDEVSSWKIRYSHPPMISIYYRLIDVAVRVHESARSLGYSAELFEQAVNLNYADLDKHWVNFDGMNYRYFIHSALLRIYGVYDKLGMIIQDLFEVELGNVTFEAVIEQIRVTDGDDRFLNSLPPLKLCNRILSTVAYKKLYDSRQDFFHLLILQDFMKPQYKEVIDTELIIAIIENCKMIYQLIDSLDIALVHFHQIGTYHQNTKI